MKAIYYVMNLNGLSICMYTAHVDKYIRNELKTALIKKKIKKSLDRIKYISRSGY